MWRLSKGNVLEILMYLAVLISTVSVLAIFVFVLKDSTMIFQKEGLGFVFGREWNVGKDIYGALPMIVGTTLVTAIALILSLPIALGSAIYTALILKHRQRLVVKSLMELLAGIPSILYGLLGVAILSTFIGDSFDLQTGRTILTAGILLAVMILPTIMTFSEDALRSVPEEYSESALGLGLTRSEMILSGVLPIAIPGIIGAVLLGVGRAIGETMAVMLVIGSIDRIPSPLYNVLVPAQTITTKLGRETAESAIGSMHWSALMGLGLILLVMVMIIFSISNIFIGKTERKI